MLVPSGHRRSRPAHEAHDRPLGHAGAKQREGYANFALTEPLLKLVLIEGEPGQDTRLDHLGVEVECTDQVNAATTRLKNAGLATFEENDTCCCYALQDKVWVHGQEPWEVYVVKADADTLGKSADPNTTGDGCCTGEATKPVLCIHGLQLRMNQQFTVRQHPRAEMTV